jgi:hypothetical protein
MGKPSRTVEHCGVGSLPEQDHLDDLLDDALAGTFPASDPTSSFICEVERPARPQPGAAAAEADRIVRRVNAALLVERSEMRRAENFAATLPADWREIIDRWVVESSHFLVVIDLPSRMLVGTPSTIADIRAMINVARADDEGAILHLKFMCTDVTIAAFIDDPDIAAVDWSTPPSRH